MKIGGSDSLPYIPLPLDNPLLQQREQVQVQQNIPDEQADQKNRELVAQQAGAHAFAQIQQNRFVDASQSIRNQALLEGKEISSPKRGMKRSPVTQQELRDPSQSPLSSGFQSTPGSRDSQALLQQKPSTTRDNPTPPEGGNAQPISVARRPMIRASVQSVAEHIAQQKDRVSTGKTESAESTTSNPAATTTTTAPEPSFSSGHTSSSQQTNAAGTNPLAAQQALQQLGASLDSGTGVSSNLSSQEQRQIMQTLAQSGDAQVLQQALQRLGDGGSWSSEHQVHALGEAIAKSAPDTVKANFVKDNLPSLEQGSNKGIALAQALGGLQQNPALVQDILQQMNPEQVQHIVSQASGKNVSVSMNPDAGATVSTSYRAEPLAAMLKAVAQVEDSPAKTAMVQAARDMLQEIQGAQSSPSHIVTKNKSDLLLQDALQSFPPR